MQTENKAGRLVQDPFLLLKKLSIRQMQVINVSFNLF